MLRAGAIVLLAILLIAAAPIPRTPSAAISPPKPQNQQQTVSAAPDKNYQGGIDAAVIWVRHEREAVEVISAIGTFLASIALVVVTGFLFRATRNLSDSTADLATAAADQIEKMARANELAERQTEIRYAAHDLAQHQFALAEKQFDLTDKQFLLAGRQSDLTEKRHGLQRLQYIAEHRPLIEIRSVGLVASGTGGIMFQPGFPVRGSLVIVNRGASDATIRQAQYRIYWSNRGLPMNPPLRDGETKQLLADLPHTMAGHESCLVEIESHEAMGAEASFILAGAAWRLFVMGAILYSDWELKERWMGFCREYTLPDINGGEGRFQPVSNRDYEYQD